MRERIHLRRRISAALVLLVGWILAIPCTLSAQADEAAAYAEVARGRAEKIVARLELPAGAAKTERVIAIIARQYVDLHALHDTRDAALIELQTLAAEQRDFVAASKAAIERESEMAVWALHLAFLGRLSGELTPAEVEAVKEGMTYGRMSRDFGVYTDMLPDLTDEQRAQIYAWMWEARERAMDGGSSEEKHWWFDKYRGRINNYLSAAGYDLKAAEQGAYRHTNSAPAQ